MVSDVFGICGCGDRENEILVYAHYILPNLINIIRPTRFFWIIYIGVFFVQKWADV